MFGAMIIAVAVSGAIAFASVDIVESIRQLRDAVRDLTRSVDKKNMKG